MRRARSHRENTGARRDITDAEEKIFRIHRTYQRARKALENLRAPSEVMDKYRPILLEDLKVSGDVTEEQRLGQRNDTIPWFWLIGTTNEEQGNEWMDECE